MELVRSEAASLPPQGENWALFGDFSGSSAALGLILSSMLFLSPKAKKVFHSRVIIIP
jgi:hypothetical protein